MWSAQSIEIIFNLMTNSHPTALKPLLCNFNFCITFHVIAEKYVDGKFVQDKENFANRAQMWVVTLNGPGSKYMQKKKQ